MKVKNVSGEDRTISLFGGRLVLAGQVFDVDAGQVYGLTCQPDNWAPADAEAKKVHAAASGVQANDNPPEES